MHHYKNAAVAQESILDAFQKAGWPDSLDVSCLPAELIRGKKKLHDAIKHLNRNLKGAVHFRQEGSGSRICWEPS